MANFFNRLRLSPPRILVCGFALIIVLGAVLLSQPFASKDGSALRYIDAIFTATSATCVTGLVVVDTGTYFSVTGQLILLMLIQMGGLGFMTMATLIALMLGKRISLRERMVLQEAMGQQNMEGIVRLIRQVIVFSVTIEAVGALLFTIRWAFDMPLGQAAYFGLFHAVSFFNNAGFDVFGEYRSLTPYVDDPFVNMVSMALIILGGIGFVVMKEVWEHRKFGKKLSLHSKVVLAMTGFLILIGALVIFTFEFTNTLEPLNWRGKILASLFQSVTPRTAGANTLDLAELRQASQFFLIILMFIGAGPGSTAGGIKITTLATLFGCVKAMSRGKQDIVLFHHRLAPDRVFKAVTVTMMGLGLVIIVAMVLSTTEDAAFIRILFETVSAFGTVGLSTGLTPDLSDIGRILLSVTMFAGRLGPLTLAYALGPGTEKELYRHPEGKLIIA
ncbi:ATP synthase subunit J [Cohnella kolymensis]|uniref:ATP synthase subunit J n=1 Tax=Cohnella kolymensis TaxID=1590652 RepID=A0ABR5A3T6_9BACL|nr:TrkH family potassium uptake protein [Cohnella kolymensis]KIL35713.1 ATP synthase subunit J [Cohnella kolymensis]